MLADFVQGLWEASSNMSCRMHAHMRPPHVWTHCSKPKRWLWLSHKAYRASVHGSCGCQRIADVTKAPQLAYL